LAAQQRKLPRDASHKPLRDIATNTSLPLAHNESGRVRILSATAARNISAKHLFLAGMSEQAFPAADSPGRLATDGEYRQLADSTQHGKSATEKSAAATRTQEEMLLFYEVLARAEESLTISYPALDDKAQTLPPSPYVIELERPLAAGGHTERITRSLPQLSPVASGQTPYSVADWRIQALARAVKKDPNRSLLASIFASRDSQPFAAAIDSGLRIVHARA